MRRLRLRVFRKLQKKRSVFLKKALQSVQSRQKEMLCLHSKLRYRLNLKRFFQQRLNNLSDAALGKLIHAVVSDEDVKNYAVEVSEVNDSLKAELAEEIKNGLEIRPTKGVRAGFRLAQKTVQVISTVLMMRSCRC